MEGPKKRKFFETKESLKKRPALFRVSGVSFSLSLFIVRTAAHYELQTPRSCM